MKNLLFWILVIVLICIAISIERAFSNSPVYCDVCNKQIISLQRIALPDNELIFCNKKCLKKTMLNKKRGENLKNKRCQWCKEKLFND